MSTDVIVQYKQAVKYYIQVGPPDNRNKLFSFNYFDGNVSRECVILFHLLKWKRSNATSSVRMMLWERCEERQHSPELVSKAILVIDWSHASQESRVVQL